jgi:hypothetical protein
VRLPWLLIAPQFDDLRADKRFVKRLKKVGINPE